jgi:2-polyprenyl-3-methyl-5-hydroxy-6-metoxy-1,4-benzoquinol methylase
MDHPSPTAAGFQDYWEQRARRYAADGPGLGAVCSFGMPHFYNWAIDLCQRLALQRWLRVRPGMRVLDVGCGVGRWSRLMAARGADVTGIDLSPTMVSEARRRAAAAATRGRSRFMVQDLATLQEREAYELILGVTVLQHIIDDDALRSAVQRMAQSLRADGVLILLEAAPERLDRTCDSATFRARPRASYRRLFEECGLEVREITGVDPAPFRTWLLPRLPRLSAGTRLAGLAAVTAMSLSIDVPLGRALVGRSWHALFVLGHARGRDAR